MYISLFHRSGEHFTACRCRHVAAHWMHRTRHFNTTFFFSFFNAAGNKCAVSRNSPSASLLPSVQKLWQFARHTQLPDANITAGPAAPPAQRAVAKKSSQKPTLSSKARLWSVAIPGAVTKPPHNGVQVESSAK